MDIEPTFSPTDAPEDILRLFDRNISATAESLVNKVLHLEKLDKKQAEMKLMIETHTLPNNAPAAVKQLLENTANASIKSQLVKSHLDIIGLQERMRAAKSEYHSIKESFHDNLLRLAPHKTK